MRNALLDLTTLVSATAYHRRSYAERYSRSIGKPSVVHRAVTGLQEEFSNTLSASGPPPRRACHAPGFLVQQRTATAVAPALEGSLPPTPVSPGLGGSMDESGARRIYARIFLGLLALSVALLAVVVLRPFLSAIAWAIVLAVGGRAPWRWLEQRLAPHRSLAASLMCVGIALVVILPAALVGSVLVDQATHAVTLLRDVLSRQQVSSVADVLALPWVTAALRWVEAWLGITPQWLLDRAGEAAAGLSTFVAAKGGGVVLGFVEALVTFVLTIFLLFFCFRDSETLVAAFADLLPVEAHERERIVSALGAMLQAIFRGALLCGLIQGATGGLGWGLAGLPSPVLAGSFLALTSLLPVGGTALVWLPGALWLWLGGSRSAAIFLGVWGAVLTSFVADNVLKPLLMRGAGELHTLVVLLGVFGGLSAFGLLGIFIGPMSLAVALMVLRVLRELTAAGQRPSEERAD